MSTTPPGQRFLAAGAAALAALFTAPIVVVLVVRATCLVAGVNPEESVLGLAVVIGVIAGGIACPYAYILTDEVLR